MNRKNSKYRDEDTQWMRCIAAFFVVLIHAVDLNSSTGVFFSAVARFSVPVFVLISGYYMLQKQRSFADLAKKSGYLLLQLVFWGCLQFGAELWLGLRTWQGPGDLLYTVAAAGGHFWYLYALIGLYLFTPILYVFCSNADQKTYHWALILTFILGSLVTMALRTGRFPLLEIIIGNAKIPYSFGFIFLYLMGDYLRQHPVKEPVLWGMIGLFGMASTVLLSLYLTPQQAAELSLSFFAPGNILGGIGFFVAAKTFFAGRSNKFVLILASCTSGIYLSHMVILRYLNLWLWPTLTALPSWLAHPLLAAVAYMIALLITLALKQLPGIRKLV